EGIDETDATTQCCGGALRMEVVPQESDEFVGSELRVVGECGLVEPPRTEPGGYQSSPPVPRSVLLVADHVGDDVPHRPPLTEARVFPLFGRQCFQEVGEVGALVSGHRQNGPGHDPKVGDRGGGCVRISVNERAQPPATSVAYV